jgi:hypothetical protein
MTETKYGKYIIDRPKDGLRPPGMTDEELKELDKHVKFPIYIDEEVVPGAFYPPSQKAANFSWRMSAERVSAEAGALVPPTPVGGAPLYGRMVEEDNRQGKPRGLVFSYRGYQDVQERNKQR